MGCFCWSMLPECYLGAHVNPLDWRSPCADFRPVPEASPTTALLLSVGGGSVSESNRSAAFGPLSGFEDHAHHRMKYAPEYSLAAARTSHGNEPVDTFWRLRTPTANPPHLRTRNLQFVLASSDDSSAPFRLFRSPLPSDFRPNTSSSLPEPSSNCRPRLPERHSGAHWAGTASE
jgi:hypothetical protein